MIYSRRKAWIYSRAREISLFLRVIKMTWKDIISKRALRPEQQNQVPDFIRQQRKDNVPPAPQLPDIPKPSQTFPNLEYQ